jgi:hypothetical protein
MSRSINAFAATSICRYAYARLLVIVGLLVVVGSARFAGAQELEPDAAKHAKATGWVGRDNHNNKSGGVKTLSGTRGITVNSGGTLMLAQNNGSNRNRINNSATMTLNGGTFNTGGRSEHGTFNNTQGIGALTLQTTSIIDMGRAASIVAFANSHLSNWSGTLNIYNWSGKAVTGGGTDQLYFGSDNTGLTASQLAEVQFFSGAGTGTYGIGALILADGEIVAIPESSTWVVGTLALAALLFKQRRRFARLHRPA